MGQFIDVLAQVHNPGLIDGFSLYLTDEDNTLQRLQSVR